VAELTPHDDFIHPAGEEPGWRETYYFDFFDPASRLAAFGWAGVRPHQGVGDVIFALWREDVLLGQFTRWDFNIPGDIGEERMSFGPLYFRPVAPFKTWEVFYDDGACRLDLTFDAIHPPYSWGHSHDAMFKTNSHHYEQQGRYRGMVRAGDQTWQVQGLGAREHSWGRDASDGVRRWIWASAQFSERFAFNTLQATLGDGQEILYGYIFRGRTNDLVRRSKIRTAYTPRGSAPSKLELQIQSPGGNVVTATARTLNAFNISHQERNKQGFHYLCPAEFHCEGQVGYGQANLFWRKKEDRAEDWSIALPGEGGSKRSKSLDDTQF
jgi:hypothetical protein